eukprot:scaffold142836_cov32-Tisochrysis_lutea.AAC.3
MMGSSAETTRRFPIITTPAELPIVDMDRRLLLLVHRNAVSNACKVSTGNGSAAAVAHAGSRRDWPPSARPHVVAAQPPSPASLALGSTASPRASSLLR